MGRLAEPAHDVGRGRGVQRRSRPDLGQAKFAKLGRAQFDTGDRLGDPEIQASLHADEDPGAEDADGSNDSGEGARYLYANPQTGAGSTEPFEDAETDPYEVVNTG